MVKSAIVCNMYTVYIEEDVYKSGGEIPNLGWTNHTRYDF